MSKVSIPRYCLLIFLCLLGAEQIYLSALYAQDAHEPPPDLKSILDTMEREGKHNPALHQPYGVTRQYKVFRSADPAPISDVMTQISFTPPDTKTFKIIQVRGNDRGKKIAIAILEQEVASTKDGGRGEINRSNYDFTFLRTQNFGSIPEYVLHIIPKRKERGLLLGDIWVDANTYRIRQIVGVPLKSPSFWVKDLHITVQFASLDGRWLPVSFDATANLRLLGLYSLSGVDLPPRSVPSQ
jgi:hypothetical protein